MDHLQRRRSPRKDPNAGRVIKRSYPKMSVVRSNLFPDRQAAFSQAVTSQLQLTWEIPLSPSDFENSYEDLGSASRAIPIRLRRKMKRPQDGSGQPGCVSAAAVSIPNSEPQTTTTRSNPSIGNGFFTPSNSIGIDRVLQLTCLPWADCLTSSSPPEQGSMVEARFAAGLLASSVFDQDTGPTSAWPSQMSENPPPAIRQLHDPSSMTLDYSLDQIPDFLQIAGGDVSDHQLLSDHAVLQAVGTPISQPPFLSQGMNYPDPDTPLNQNMWEQNANLGYGDYMDVCVFPVQTLSYSPPSPANSNQVTSQVSRGRISVERPGNRDRGPFQTDKERQETAMTRIIGACTRCRSHRVRCELDPKNNYGTCLTCQGVSNPRLFASIQCIRGKITEIKLFKSDSMPVRTSRWSEAQTGIINEWASNTTKTIQVTEGYCVNSLPVLVREFIPVDGDRLHVHWAAQNTTKSVMLPPYAIADLKQAEKSYKDFIDRRGSEFFSEFFRAAVGEPDQFILQTYDMAFYVANKRSKTSLDEVKLLKEVLRLWVAIRLNTRTTVITGDETLGMTKDILDSTSPFYGKIPIPPVMSAQIALILQAMQEKFRHEVLTSLQKLTHSKSRSAWFTIYICTFVLLHNCALITKHDASYAIRYGMKTKFARPKMVAEYHHGANILLDCWHRYNGGKQPFKPSVNIEDHAKSAKLDEEQKKFVLLTRIHVKEKERHFKEIHHQGLYEHDYYFLSQLYEVDWMARTAI